MLLLLWRVEEAASARVHCCAPLLLSRLSQACAQALPQVLEACVAACTTAASTNSSSSSNVLRICICKADRCSAIQHSRTGATACKCPQAQAAAAAAAIEAPAQVAAAAQQPAAAKFARLAEVASTTAAAVSATTAAIKLHIPGTSSILQACCSCVHHWLAAAPASLAESWAAAAA
jgi:hypothetical protein